jgi:hypothetical protein
MALARNIGTGAHDEVQMTLRATSLANRASYGYTPQD